MSGVFREFVDAARGTWEAYVHHPWMSGIYDGTLTVDQFKFFLVHDMPYQVDFLEALLLAATRSEEPETWLRIRAAIVEEAQFEEALLTDLMADWTYDRWSAGPAREGYMNHLSRVALEGTPGEIAAALLPCSAGWSEATASPVAGPAGHASIARWIAFYETFDAGRGATQDLLKVLDREIARSGAGHRNAAQEIFMRSVHHQIAVLDAAWRLSDDWPTHKPSA